MSKGNPQGILLIGLLVVAGMAVIGWASPAASKFTQAVADTLYCAIASTNCASTYCAVNDVGVLYNCSALNAGQYCETDGGCFALGAGQQVNYRLMHSALDSFTSTAYTSITWTNGQTIGAWDGSPANAGVTAGDNLMCWASLNYIVNSTSVRATFQIKDYTVATQASAPFEAGPGITASENNTISLGWVFTARVSDQIKLDVRVTGANMKVTVGSGYLYCLDVNPALAGYGVT